jgi:hypothetical protein
LRLDISQSDPPKSVDPIARRIILHEDCHFVQEMGAAIAAAFAAAIATAFAAHFSGEVDFSARVCMI